ncbi:hypothetical protein DL770_004872 [Monosporascus sp. CRB-9-2]|nr:hypothetical protein DL770_004872 [Monosporascus sp. CRB-9-2]
MSKWRPNIGFVGDPIECMENQEEKLCRGIYGHGGDKTGIRRCLSPDGAFPSGGAYQKIHRLGGTCVNPALLERTNIIVKGLTGRKTIVLAQY